MKIHHNIPEVAGARLQSITSTIQAVTTSLLSTSQRGLYPLVTLVIALGAGNSVAAKKPKKAPKNGLVNLAKFNGDAGNKGGNSNPEKIQGPTFTPDRQGNPGKASPSFLDLNPFQQLWLHQIVEAEKITKQFYQGSNKQYIYRAACRVPRHFAVKESWLVFWSKQTCGYCDRPADRCSWLRSQKEDIKRRWTKTTYGNSRK